MPDAEVTKPADNPVRVLGRVLSWAFLTILAVVVAAVVVIPRVLGAVPLNVLTGSMTPTYRPGDIVVVLPTPVAELNAGDVVTFQAVSGDPRLTTHRLVGFTHDGDSITSVITRGDANNANDPAILPEQVKGRVIYSVPLVGHLSTPRNSILAGTTLVGGGLVIYSITGIIYNLRNSREEEQVAAT